MQGHDESMMHVDGDPPGPVTTCLTEVGCDFEKQYLDRPELLDRGAGPKTALGDWQ